MNNYLIVVEGSRWVIAQANSPGEIIEKNATVNYCMKHNKSFMVVNLASNEVEIIVSEEVGAGLDATYPERCSTKEALE